MPEKRAPAAKAGAAASASYSRLPLAFEANGGRSEERVKFLARGSGYSIFLTPNSSVLSLSRGKDKAPAVLRTTLVGARSNPSVAGEAKLPGVVNAYKGNRPEEWKTGIPTYRRVRYESVYPGVDLVYYGRQRQLEYDFVVAPGADPSRIALDFEGASRIRLASNGDLVIRTDGGALRHLRPIVYQRVDGRRREVAGRYVVAGDRVRFALGRYDRARELIIDPVLTYSSFLGGAGTDYAESIAVTSDGGALVAGQTFSNDFPGATARSGSRTDSDVIVSKVNASGTALVYSTYLGGDGSDSDLDTADTDAALDVATTGSLAYVVGFTASADYPTVSPTLDSCTNVDNDAFFTRLNATGALSYSTCLGGTADDFGRGVDVRSSGTGLSSATHVYIVGSTSSPSGFPVTTANAADTTPGTAPDAFLTRVTFPSTLSCIQFGTCDPTNSYTTFIGGEGSDLAHGVATDSNNDTYITGQTSSDDFGSVGTDPDPNGTDAFVAKYDTFLSGSGSRVFATWFGGTNTDYGYAIDVTEAGAPWIAGKTYSFDDTTTSPTNEGLPSPSTGDLKHDPGDNVDPDGFIGTTSSTGTSPSSTYVGGTGSDELLDIDVHEVGSAVAQYVVGNTDSGPDPGFFEPQNEVPGQQCDAGNKQVLFVKRSSSQSPNGPGMVVTCLGGTIEAGDYGTGITVDSAGTAYITGYTGGNFPQVGAFQGGFAGPSYDAFVARLAQKPPMINSGPSGVISTTSATFTFSTDEDEMGYECSTPVSNRLVAGTRADCNTGTRNYTGLAEGDHTFEVVTEDDTGAYSAPATRTFTVDTLDPAAFDLLSPDNAATTTTRPTFSWQEAADAGTAVTYRIMVDGQKLQDVGSDACSGGACTAEAATPIATGSHQWNVVATDGASPPHTTPSASTRTFTAIDPPVARLTIAPNPALAGRAVTFDATASADATHKIAKHLWDLDGDGTFELETAEPTTTRTYNSAQVIPVGLKVVDETGTESAPTTVELRVNDLNAPGSQIGVTINEGAQYTNKVDVTLSVSAPAATTSLLVANDGGFLKALNLAPATKVPWRLDSSGPERLPKTVYLRFLVGSFASPNYTDDIILDERPPVVDQAALVNAPAASSAVAAAMRTYRVRVKARDSNSGVRGVQITANKRKPGKLIRYTAKTRGKTKIVKVRSVKRPRWLRAKDLAGNYSRWKKLR